MPLIVLTEGAATTNDAPTVQGQYSVRTKTARLFLLGGAYSRYYMCTILVRALPPSILAFMFHIAELGAFCGIPGGAKL